MLNLVDFLLSKGLYVFVSGTDCPGYGCIDCIKLFVAGVLRLMCLSVRMDIHNAPHNILD